MTTWTHTAPERNPDESTAPDDERSKFMRQQARFKIRYISQLIVLYWPNTPGVLGKSNITIFRAILGKSHRYLTVCRPYSQEITNGCISKLHSAPYFHAMELPQIRTPVTICERVADIPPALETIHRLPLIPAQIAGASARFERAP